ncbi:hypothetical protein CPB84DRAFT_1843468 [Gymnopilus junonius]|uniref:HNH nuclease domain-containing protein n=1 Tax=Gymnopilus junonius TaxID=109634 RepID=A0A9P5TS31_GYMJU|nr:hypothetical protein CPB84DRAFT_1843468 [Gymnopilus junonius]
MTELPTFADISASNRFYKFPSEVLEAYRRVVSLEKTLEDGKDDKKLLCVRILGYLLLEAPSHEARLAVARRVRSSETDDALIDLGKWYFNHFILPFRVIRIYNEPWPTPYMGPFCESIEDMSRVLTVETPMNRSQTTQNALVRDGFRCVVTGLYDLFSVENNAELESSFNAESQRSSGTDCASFLKNDPHQYLLSSTLWEIMDEFGYENVTEELRGEKTHRLENAITLSRNVHEEFNHLDLWLELTENENVYRVIAIDPKHFNASLLRSTVTCTTPDKEKLPLPSPSYVSIHAACAKVAQLSGAASYITKVLDNVTNWESGFFAEDGSLSQAMYQAFRL